MGKLNRAALLFCLVVLLGSTAQAQNQIAGLLRDEYALGLTPTIKSAGMGGTYVGVYDIRSMNPAAIASSTTIEAEATYSHYGHDDAPESNRWRVDTSVPVPIIGGTARAMFDGFYSDGTDSTKLPGEAPVDFSNDFNLGLHYGREITEWLAVGAGGYPYDKAKINMGTPGGKVRGEALSQFGSVHTGIIVRPLEMVDIGMSYIHIKDELKAGLPDGSGLKSNFYLNYWAFGLSARPLEGTLLAADYWYGDLHGHQNPDAEFNQTVRRWNFGAEQIFCDYFQARTGINNEGFTFGFTIIPLENFDISYAYIHKAMRDKESAFGETQYHGVSLGYMF